MRRSSSWFLRGGLAAISLLALPACVEGTTSSTTASSPSEGMGTPAPPVTTPPSTTPPVVTVPATPPVDATPAPPPATTGQPSTPLPSTAPAVVLLSLDGTWESPSCGSRTYPRRITFAEAASFTAEDLVSPCPKGTNCVWSGIINRQGTYRVEKDTVTLTVARTGTGPAKVEFPTTLTLDANHAPVEGGACVYKRAGGARKP